MALYKLDFLGADQKVIQGYSDEDEKIFKYDIREVDIGEVILVLSEISGWESPETLRAAHEALSRLFPKRVVIINHPKAKEIKFARLEKVEHSSSKDKKSLYSRKLRIRGKYGVEDMEEADVKVCKEEEKVQEEKASTRDEEDTVGWRWPH